MTRILSRTHQAPPPESVLQQLRIPFVRRATLLRGDAEEEVFVIDIGLAGVFVERAQALENDEHLSIRFPWPGSERPFEARCRVAWWHPKGEALSSKSLPPGGGLQFVEMSEPDGERLRALLLEYCQQQPRVRRFLRHWPAADRQGDDPTAG
jgi:hypothetical protein